MVISAHAAWRRSIEILGLVAHVEAWEHIREEP
jgi:hypothetical protein